jgi:hypothetical protein
VSGAKIIAALALAVLAGCASRGAVYSESCTLWVKDASGRPQCRGWAFGPTTEQNVRARLRILRR